MLTVREYKKAESLEEAYALNQKKANRILGGMLWMRLENPSISTAIDLSGLGLDKIEETEDAFLIGAMVTLRQLEKDEGLNTYTQGAVAESVKHIVGVQLRNMATIGGSIWSRFGFSDVSTMFLSLETYVELYKGGIVPLAQFNQMKRDGDILTHVIVKKEKGLSCCYESVRRTATDFPILTMAAAGRDGGCFRFSVGARPGLAVQVEDEEQLLLKGGSKKERAEKFATFLGKRIPTGSNLRGSSIYRTHLVEVLAEREALALLKKRGEKENL